MMQLPELMDWMFKGMMGGIGAYGVYILSQLQISIEKLNIKMAVVVTKVEAHDDRIARLEDR